MNSTANIPHFLFVPGGWHNPECWDGARKELKATGYHSIAIPLPSINNATFDMTEDVQAIHAAAKSLVDQGQDVVLVLHSYSGQPGSDALKGLSRNERQAEGLKGAVVRVVFIMAWTVPEGYQPAERGDYAAAPDWIFFDETTGLATVSVDDAKRIFYNDLPDEEAAAWAQKLQPWSIGCNFSKSTYAGWKHIPSTFVLCKNDQSFFGLYAKPMLDLAKADELCQIDTLEEVDAGHCVMISKPVWTAQMLGRAASASITRT